MHGQRLDGTANADALRALPDITRSKDVPDLTNAAAKVSLKALGRAPDETAWRVERSTLSRAEVQGQVEETAPAPDDAAQVQHGESAPTRQRAGRRCDRLRHLWPVRPVWSSWAGGKNRGARKRPSCFERPHRLSVGAPVFVCRPRERQSTDSSVRLALHVGNRWHATALFRGRSIAIIADQNNGKPPHKSIPRIQADSYGASTNARQKY